MHLRSSAMYLRGRKGDVPKLGHVCRDGEVGEALGDGVPVRAVKVFVSAPFVVVQACLSALSRYALAVQTYRIGPR